MALWCFFAKYPGPEKRRWGSGVSLAGKIAKPVVIEGCFMGSTGSVGFAPLPSSKSEHRKEEEMKGKKRMVLGILMALLLAGSVVQAAEPIRVGAILAVTGPASFLGGPEARTLEMLAEEVNAKGGINGHKVELFIMDSGASPEKAVSFAKQLIEEKKVLAILGPSTSGETMQIKGIAEEGKTIRLSCAAAEVIVNPVAKWVFKTPQKDSDAIQAIFNQMKRMKITNIGVLSGNDGFG